jgi:aspartate kinase
MATIVQKYGGTSVEGRDRLMAVAGRVAALRRGGHDVVVVVSAPGGTTDSLLRSATDLSADPTQRELDMLMTAGERISMSLLAIALNSIGCPAISFTGSQVGIITDTAHTDARILEIRPGRLVRELEGGKVVVVGGFQGVSTNKDVTTLGRGGSDTTAVALAAALGAERCEILTDVDGIYTADPNVVPRACRINELSYEDMAELARFGATVLKEDAVRFAERHGITIHVRKSDSDAPGTIVLEDPAQPDRPVTGLSLLTDVELVKWVGAAAARAMGGLQEVSRYTKFCSAVGDVVFGALDRAGAARLLEGDEEEMSLRRVDLICAVGREAGSAECAAAAVAVVRSSGESPLAMAARGRSTVLAVEPESSRHLLKKLHGRFFPGEAAPEPEEAQ